MSNRSPCVPKGCSTAAARIASTGAARAFYTSINITSSSVGGTTVGLGAMPSTATAALVLAAGLVLCAAGLFGPLGGERER